MAEVCESEGSPLSVDDTTSATATVQDQTPTVVVGVEWEAAEMGSFSSSTVDKSSGGRRGSTHRDLTTLPPSQLLHGRAGVQPLGY